LSVDPTLDILLRRERGSRHRARPGIGHQRRDQVVTVVLDLLALSVK
jgi:hypothetical protein